MSLKKERELCLILGNYLQIRLEMRQMQYQRNEAESSVCDAAPGKFISSITRHRVHSKFQSREGKSPRGFTSLPPHKTVDNITRKALPEMALCQPPLNSNYCFKDRHYTILATPLYQAFRQNLYISSSQKNHKRKVFLSSPKLWLGDIGQSLPVSLSFTKMEYIFWFYDLQPVEI